MIQKSTPYKLAEIIRDTWPGIFYKSENKFKDHQNHKSGSHLAK